MQGARARTPSPRPVYTSKIIKAGALLPDTKLLLAHWDLDADVRTNLDRARRDNIFGKASRSRVQDILAIFRQRYLGDPELLPALVTLVKGSLPAASLDRILYFAATRADALLRDVVLQVLVPHADGYRPDVSIGELIGWLRLQVAAGRTSSVWSDETVERVAQGLLATLRDFGVLEGAVNKRLAPPHLPVDAFALIVFLLRRSQPSGERLLRDPGWGLFFLPVEAVERSFIEAQAEGLLQYHAAGSVIRIGFPAETAQDYARALLRRPH